MKNSRQLNASMKKKQRPGARRKDAALRHDLSEQTGMLQRERDSSTYPSSTCNGHIRSFHVISCHIIFKYVPSMIHTWPSPKASLFFDNFLHNATTAEHFVGVQSLHGVVDASARLSNSVKHEASLAARWKRDLVWFGGPELEDLELSAAELLCFLGALSFEVKSWRRSRCFCGGPLDANVRFRMLWTQWGFHAAKCTHWMMHDSHFLCWRALVSLCVVSGILCPGADSERRPPANLCAVAKSEAGHKTLKSKTLRSVSWL